MSMFPMQPQPYTPPHAASHWFTATPIKRKRAPEPEPDVDYDASTSDADSSSSDDTALHPPLYAPTPSVGGLSYAYGSPYATPTGKSNVMSSPSPVRRTPPKRLARQTKRLKRDSTESFATVSGPHRAAGMESGFARMTLLHENAPLGTIPPTSYPPTPVVRQNVTQPPIPEEVVSVPEVNMKSRSWFEPEKDRESRLPSWYDAHTLNLPLRTSPFTRPGIVVLDLDGSDTETESTANTPSRSTTHSPDLESMSGETDPFFRNGGNTRYSISKSYLNRIASLPKPPTPPPSLGPRAGALVLYKSPSGFPGSLDGNSHDASFQSGEQPQFQDIDYIYEDNGPELFASIEEVDDDHDVEMMDVDME
ncbi:hypothetical protein FRB99_001943 [Tulasnella sp. 403]|nr:hypothetical protein FRB99_001943 [Tulasnella sp. 403]